MRDTTQDSENRRPLTPMEKAQADARSRAAADAGTETGGGEREDTADTRRSAAGPVVGAAGRRGAGTTEGQGVAGASGLAAGGGGSGPGSTTGRERGADAVAGAGAEGGGQGSPTHGSPTHASPLLEDETCDELSSRMQRAVVGFVDGPRDAVAEADHVLEELTERFTDAVNRHRRTLRGSWQPARQDGAATAPDTEQLRLALRDYRELAERLLHV